MKKVIFLLAAAALLSASCSSEPIEDIALNSELQYRVESNFIDRSNARVAINLDEECFYSELMAGQTIAAGNIIVNKDPLTDEITISYLTEGEWTIVETQLSISDYENPDFPMTGSGNPQIGKFEVNESFDELTNMVTFTFSAEDVQVFNQFSVAAHAVVVDGNGNQETAWSAGEDFPGRSWATYTRVDLSNCFVFSELE